MTRTYDPARPRRLTRPQAVRSTDPRHSIHSPNGTGRTCRSCGLVTYSQVPGPCGRCGR